MFKMLKRMAHAYLAVLTCSTASLLMLSAEPRGPGCYASHALLWGAECSGFAGSGTVAFILNLPLYLLYAPLLGASGLFERQFHAAALCALALGMALWAPLLFLLWSKAVAQARS